MAEQNQAKPGELNIYNQIMETFTVNQLAELTQQVGQELGYDVKINSIQNPRIEKEEHYYNPSYQGLMELGVKPHYLTKDSMKEIFKIVSQYKSKIRKDVVYTGVKW